MNFASRFANRTCNLAHFQIRNAWRTFRGMFGSPYISRAGIGSSPLHQASMRVDAALIPEETRAQIISACREYANGRFCLLGNTWRSYLISNAGETTHSGLPRRGIHLGGETTHRRLRSEMARRWELLPRDYRPIDWALEELTSGHWGRPWDRFTQKTGIVHGFDIKHPWELGRLQHLPILALASHLDPDQRSSWGGVFRAHLLDFSACNPPGRGVQWACAMDASIRLANICLGHELLLASGRLPDHSFEEVVRSTILEHVEWIRKNLETTHLYTANHFLANLGGLLVGLAWLPEDERPNELYHRTRRAFVEQCRRQFHEDGSNFEASSGYHRLSSEIASWGVSMIIRIDGRATEIPEEVVRRLHRAGSLLRDLQCPDGGTSLIGDFDSGRFLRCIPAWKAGTFPPIENPRDFRDCPAGIDALFGKTDSGNHRDRVTPSLLRSPGGLEVPEESREQFRDLASEDTSLAGEAQRYVFRFEGSPLLKDGRSEFYPGLGVLVVRSPRLFLVFRCGDQGLNGLGGHAHCDLLGIELWVDEKPVLLDPGTFCYGADLEVRNRWRSIQAHWAPQPESTGEPSTLKHPFRLPGDWKPRWVRTKLPILVAEHRAWGLPVRRSIEFAEDRILVIDSCSQPLRRLPTPVSSRPWTGMSTHFASGYGFPPTIDGGPF